MKKKLITLLQILLGGGVVGFFFYKILQDPQKVNDFKLALHSAGSHWQVLVLGFAMYFACIVLCTLRWQVLLKSQDISISFLRTIALYFIGHFFSMFMPGSTSGDLLKAVYVAREAPDKKTEVVATVFIDRIVGLLGLIFLNIGVMIPRFHFFLAYRQTRMAMAFNLAMLLAVIIGSVVVFRRNLLEKWSFFTRLEEKTKIGKIITRAYSAFHVCMKHPGVLKKTILLSIVNHTFFILYAYYIGKSLGITISYIDYLTVFPVINALAAISPTPGGTGAREAATIVLLGTFGVPAAGAFALSILIYLGLILWGLFGGIVYLIYVAMTGYDARLAETNQS